MAFPFDPTKHILNIGQEFQSGLGMPPWAGVFPTEYVEKKAAEYVAAGWEHFSMAAPGLASTWVRDTLIPIHFQVMEIFMRAGAKKMDWGAIPSGGTNFQKVDQWLNQFSLESHALAFQALCDQYNVTGRWIVGNENEASWNRDSTQKALTFDRVSNIATVTFTYPHNLEVGDSLYIDGVYASITEIIDEYSFRQNNTGVDISKTNVAATLADTTVGRVMSRASEHLKSLEGFNMETVYRSSGGIGNGGVYYFQLMNSTGGWWASDYLNSINVRSLNIYGEGGNMAATLTDFKNHINTLMTTYGANAEVSELGVFSTSSTAAVVSRNPEVYFQQWKSRVDYLAANNVRFQIFADTFPEGDRDYLSLTHPARFGGPRAYQRIYDYVLGRSQNSVMVMGWNDGNNDFNYDLVNVHNAREGLEKVWAGSLLIPGDGDARDLSTTVDFDKSKAYSWCFWAKMLDLTTHPVNTLIRVGTGNVHGYRIILERASGTNYFQFQDLKTSSTTHRWVVPTSVDPHKWHHYALTWTGNGDSWTPFLFVDGKRLTQTSGSITWNSANLVAGANMAVTLGYEWKVQTLYGYISDVMFFERMIQPDEVWASMNQRAAIGAAHHWTLEDESADTATDGVGSDNLTLTVNSGFALDAPVPTPEPNYVFKSDKIAGFNIGQDEQTGAKNTIQRAEDLTRIASIARNYVGAKPVVRIGGGSHTYTPALNATRNYAMAAYDAGFDVIFVSQDYSGSGLTDANWSTHVSNVLTDIAYFVAQGYPNIHICGANEIEYSEVAGNLTNSIDKMGALATSAKAVSGWTGDFHVSIAFSALDYSGATNGWLSKGLAGISADIDEIAYHPYGDANITPAQVLTQVDTRTQDLYDEFGSMLYVGEWNMPSTSPGRPSTTAEKVQMLQDMLDIFINIGITKIIPFNYRWDKNAGNSALWSYRVGRSNSELIDGICTLAA